MDDKEQEFHEAAILDYVFKQKANFAGFRFVKQPLLRANANAHHRIIMRYNNDSDTIIWMAIVNFKHGTPCLVKKFGDMDSYYKDVAMLRMFVPDEAFER